MMHLRTDFGSKTWQVGTEPPVWYASVTWVEADGAELALIRKVLGDSAPGLWVGAQARAMLYCLWGGNR